MSFRRSSLAVLALLITAGAGSAHAAWHSATRHHAGRHPSARHAARHAHAAGRAATATPQFFAPNSIWNTWLALNQPIDPASPAYAAEVLRQVQTYGTGVMTADDGGYGVPIYTVPANQPLVAVSLDGQSPGLQAALDQVPLPPTATPAAGSDANLAVWQPSTDTLWEFWHFRSTADGFHAGYGGRMLNVSTSSGSYADVLSPDGSTYLERWYWGTTAAKFSLVAGVITLKDLARGYINHALCLSLPQVESGVFSLPGQATDGTYSGPNAIPEGAHLRLNPNLHINTLNLSPLVHMIAQAAKRYGIIVVNTGGGVGFRGQDPTSGTDPWPALLGPTPGLTIKTQFPWSELQMLPMTLQG